MTSKQVINNAQEMPHSVVHPLDWRCVGGSIDRPMMHYQLYQRASAGGHLGSVGGCRLCSSIAQLLLMSMHILSSFSCLARYRSWWWTTIMAVVFTVWYEPYMMAFSPSAGRTGCGCRHGNPRAC
jgi:hypothetical protein